ncbi:MAG: DUF481 domain-containing protein [Halieaceae bacterium]|jgi:putative salt-induced outer membrane protein YdiY|nr:DUF481 domain-containing protein [Halieaceae bacterium]
MNTGFRKLGALVLGAGALVFAAASSADEMVMKNGSRLVGKLISAEGGLVVFDTPFAGEISVKSANIDTIRTDETVTVQMADGQVFREKQIVASGDTLTMQRAGEAPRAYDIDDIALVNPPAWKLGEGYHFSGRSSAAFAAQRGNADTDDVNADYQATWQSLRDRYDSRGYFERGLANGEDVSNSWQLRNKYDHFTQAEGEYYWGGKLRLEFDEFADLDLRTVVGPHFGKQFFSSKRLTLSAEAGPVYVDEQFDVAEDNNYWGMNWDLNLESDILGFGTTLYVLHDGTFNFDSADEPLLNATVGLRMPLIYGFETSVQARFEYNGGAPGNTEELDEAYSFRIGYAW